MPTKDVSITQGFLYGTNSIIDCVPSRSQSYAVRTLTRTRTGDKVPNYRTLIRNGGNATSFCTGRYDSLQRISAASASVSFERPLVPNCGSKISNVTFWGQQNPPSFNATGAVGGTKPDNQALVQLNKAIKNQYEHWNGSIFVGEVLQTAKGLISPAKGIRTILSKYLTRLEKKKKLFRKGESKEWLNAISGEWLEIQFGLQPLINDSKDLAETLGRFDSTDDFRRSKLRGSGYHEQVVLDSLTTGGRGGYLITQTVHRITSSTRVVRRCGMSYALSGPFGVAKDLQRLCGFTAQNFVPTLWEILPWSFVIDYFVNVQQILEGHFTDRSLVTWTSKTTINDGITTVDERILDKETIALLRSVTGDKAFSYSGTFGGYTSRSRSFTRTNEGPTSPTLTMRVPGIDSLKWLNLAALIAQGSSVRNTPFRR